jgi:hypothetical protein
LVDAHTKAISKLDTGLVARGLSVSRLTSTVLFLEGKRELVGLDWGGGNGLLSRLMRDMGFQMKSYDRYAENILSEGFSVEPNEVMSHKGFMTVVECFEHLINPHQELSEVSESQEYLFLTTELIANPAPNPSNSEWWYFMPESGQHVTFASKLGMARFAERLDFPNQYSVGALHILSRSPLRWRTKITLSIRITRILMTLLIPELLKKKYGLTESDHANLKADYN